jgi:2-methylaconitate cis-trans-isomerase PrpF
MNANIIVGAFFVKNAHRAVQFSAALCTAAVAEGAGTVVYETVERHRQDLRMGHVLRYINVWQS